MAEPFNANEGNLLLKALAPDEAALLASQIKSTTLRVGTSLHEPGEELDCVYFPQGGVISCMVVMQNGEMTEAGMIGREGIVGGLAGLGAGPAISRALVSVSGPASRVPATAYRSILKECGALRDKILRYEHALIQQIQQNSACNILHSLEQRFCRWVLQAGDRTNDVAIPMTQEFQAQLLGVHRGSLNLVVRGLRQNDVIGSPRPGWLQIVDRSKMMARVCECYDVMRRATPIEPT